MLLCNIDCRNVNESHEDLLIDKQKDKQIDRQVNRQIDRKGRFK